MNSKRVTKLIKLPGELHENLAREARRRRRSVDAIVAGAIQRDLKSTRRPRAAAKAQP